MLHMVCLNVRKTYGDQLDEVLGRVPHRLTFHAPPDELATKRGSRTKLDAVYTSLREFMTARVASWQGYEPLVLLARDAGNAYVRHWLTNDEDRELVSVLVLIDPLHGVADPAAHFGEAFAGVVEFARDCMADPGEKMLLAVSPTVPAGALRSVGFSALLRHAVWAVNDPGEIADTRQADNIEILDVPDFGTNDLPELALDLLRSRLVPFAAELGPASAPEPLLL